MGNMKNTNVSSRHIERLCCRIHDLRTVHTRHNAKMCYVQTVAKDLEQNWFLLHSTVAGTGIWKLA